MNNKHWTNNPELIERFILQGMNPEERNELEDHLRICEVCKRAVRNEQLLVAGIRRSGREQFKSALAAKLAAIPAEVKKTPWVQILSAAAVIIIVLTVGIYNRWFETTMETAVETTADIAKLSEESKPAESPKDESLGAASKPFTSPQTKSSTQDEIRRVATSPRAGVPPPTMAAKKEKVAAADDAAPLSVGEAAGATESEAMASAEIFWIEGNVLDTDAERDKAGREERHVEFLKGRADSPASKRAAARLEQNQSATANTIVLNQQNTLTLPAERQRVQQLNKSASVTSERVITKLERIGEQTQMTFYFDSLVDDNDLANATIETPRRDSLIVSFRNQRIGYRLPSNVDARQLRLTK
jgi:hypothetical protein